MDVAVAQTDQSSYSEAPDLNKINGGKRNKDKISHIDLVRNNFLFLEKTQMKRLKNQQLSHFQTV